MRAFFLLVQRKERGCFALNNISRTVYIRLNMKKSYQIKIIVKNPPTEKQKQKRLKELSEFLSKELSSKSHTIAN
jgi:hypothetical protein